MVETAKEKKDCLDFRKYMHTMEPYKIVTDLISFEVYTLLYIWLTGIHMVGSLPVKFSKWSIHRQIKENS